MRKSIRRGFVIAAAATGLWALGTTAASASPADLPETGSLTGAAGETVSNAAAGVTGDLPTGDVVTDDLAGRATEKVDETRDAVDGTVDGARHTVDDVRQALAGTGEAVGDTVDPDAVEGAVRDTVKDTVHRRVDDASEAAHHLRDQVVKPTVDYAEHSVDRLGHNIRLERTLDRVEVPSAPVAPSVPALPTVPAAVFEMLSAAAVAGRLDDVTGTVDGLAPRYVVPSLPTDLPSGLSSGLLGGVPVILPGNLPTTGPAGCVLADPSAECVHTMRPAHIPALPATGELSGLLPDDRPAIPEVPSVEVFPVVPSAPSVPAAPTDLTAVPAVDGETAAGIVRDAAGGVSAPEVPALPPLPAEGGSIA